jgi:outer membrane lipoprotein-sorting protein
MRLAILCALGSAAGVAWAGDPAPDPAAVLKDVEAPIRTARTLRADVAVDMGKELGSLMGRVLVAPGDRVRIELAGTLDGKKTAVLLVSDGTRMRMTGDGGPGKDQPTEPKLGGTVAGSFARLGVAVPLLMSVEVVEDGTARRREPFDLDRYYPVSGLKLAKAEPVGGRDTRAVGYAVRAKGAGGPLAVTTWADAKTNLPVKRVVRIAGEGKTVEVTETYTNVVLDGKADDAEFELPK